MTQGKNCYGRRRLYSQSHRKNMAGMPAVSTLSAPDMTATQVSGGQSCAERGIRRCVGDDAGERDHPAISVL